MGCITEEVPVAVAGESFPSPAGDGRSGGEMTNANQSGASHRECQRLRNSGPFTGSNDFHEFTSVLGAAPSMREVPVTKEYLKVGLAETWYECATCHSVWRLVDPDPPDAGLWDRVK
jgi:hypothetical protein